jgi:hypothetical protein
LRRSRQESGVREIRARRSIGRGLETGASRTAPALDPTAKKPSDVAERQNIERDLYDTLKQTVKNSSDNFFEVPPKEGIWFTDMGPSRKEEQIQNLQQGKYLLYFLGAIKYKDAVGIRYTTYCRATEGRPKVIFICHKYTEEDVSKL